MTLIAEDLLLLLLDDTKGTVSTWGKTDAVLGGALLAELAVMELVTVDEHSSIWRTDKVHATDGPADLDPLLAGALAEIAEKDRKASTLVGRIGKGLEDRLAARLADRGILQRREGRLLGLFPRTTWPAADTSHEAEVRQRITACLVDDAPPDERTGALIALLAAIDQAHSAVTEGTSARKRDLEKRAKQIAEGQWAAKAVKAPSTPRRRRCVGGGWIAVDRGHRGQLAEVEVPVAGPLQLEEVRVRRQRDRGVPDPAGVLAARDLAEHRPEEGVAVDRDRGRADLVAHLVHAEVVALLDRLVVRRVVHRVGQRGRDADLLERLLDQGAVELLATLGVLAGAERGVQLGAACPCRTPARRPCTPGPAARRPCRSSR